MNKIKLLYDVVMTMRNKEVFNGTFKAEATKDLLKTCSVDSSFEKNISSGQAKAKISTEMDCDGKKIKHESTTEFDSQCCDENMHHGFMKHMHFFHKHHNVHDKADCCRGIKCGGIKGKLTKVAFVLSVLNSLKVEEQEDKSILLSLDLNEIPEDIKKAFNEKCNEGSDCCSSMCMKEFHNMNNPKASINIWINKNSEIAKVVLTIRGTHVDDVDAEHAMSAKAELILNW